MAEGKVNKFWKLTEAGRIMFCIFWSFDFELWSFNKVTKSNKKIYIWGNLNMKMKLNITAVMATVQHGFNLIFLLIFILFIVS